MGNLEKEEKLKLFCPHCTHQITPETTQCPGCGYVYGPDTLEFLAKLVDKTPQKYPDERRRHVRVHKTFKIAYPTLEAFIENYLSDIGTGGLFIKTNAPWTKGERFNLKISLPGEEKQLEVLCEVVWIREEERVTIDGKFPPGMGVRFVNPSEELIEKILGILRESLP